MINTSNYHIHRKIEASVVSHPEKLPNSQMARLTSFGFANLAADLYWLKTIQYIGWNAISGEYKEYLSVIMNLITDLNPYFESPYTIGQLLIPSSKWTYDDTTDPANFQDYRDAEALGLKWVKNFCDEEKTKLIFSENNLQNIFTQEKYKNPCQSYKIPYYLAYIYYFYLHENTKAADYYKIVAAQEDAPKWSRVLAAIMQGKGGEREKSLYMFLSLADSASNQGDSCQILTRELQNAYAYININKLPIHWDFIESIELSAKKYLPILTEENEDSVFADTECTNFLAKAIREINLLYLEEADANYVADHPEEVSAHTPEKLLKEWYISFIPTDYQQYTDKNDNEEYGIIYRYNSIIGRFDYEMGY